MLNLFSDDARRDPYPLYRELRAASPVLHLPPLDAWMIFDYDGVKRVTGDHEAFSSAVPAPDSWFIFYDPPRHTKLRALITRAFTPRVVANLETRIRDMSRELLDRALLRGEMDLADDYSVPLPTRVIAGMLGIPETDWGQFKRWSDAILRLSYDLLGGDESFAALNEFRTATGEMEVYLAELIEQRCSSTLDTAGDDLLIRLVEAEVDGERLTHREILGFFQLLLVAGQETTTNLINNAILCLMEYPGELARLRSHPELLPSAIEEVLRYRSPLQWIMRTPRQDIELHGQVIPAGKLVLPMLGSANRDPGVFADVDRFDISRDPNPHIAFGHGIHFCLGAALARMEARIALRDFLRRAAHFEPASTEPWQPRRALHVHGPAHLPLRIIPAPDAG